MGRVTGDEHTALAIIVSKAEAQLPETDIVECDIDRGTDSFFKERVKRSSKT